MRRIREVLRLKFEQGCSLREIAQGAAVPVTTARDYLGRAAAAGLSYEAAAELSDAALEAALFGPQETRDTRRPLPDWAAVDRQLRRRGVTLKLLWQEYLAAYPDGYGYTQFCEHFQRWQTVKRGLSMRQVRRAGEAMQVDYAGMTMSVVEGGKPRAAQVFVACLPCSGLTFAEATWTQQLEDWLGSHVRAFTYFGGVAEKLVPDNLKVGVSRASYYDPEVNRSYQDLASHYGVAVVPTRVRKPKDKASVENAVQQVERWVLAPLRNRPFFSLTELNQAIAEQLEALNDKAFAPPRQGSRRQLFEEIERAELKPLPAAPYRYGRWLSAKVNLDYHVAVEDHYYSVPYALVHKQVEVLLSGASVAILHRGERVASHLRSAERGRHTTLAAHMPPAHQKMAERTPERLRERAAAVGEATAAYVERLLSSRDHPEQGFRSCLGILRLAGSYGPERLEAACRRALDAGVASSGYVERLLKSNQPLDAAPPEGGAGRHANLRGPGYYQ